MHCPAIVLFWIARCARPTKAFAAHSIQLRYFIPFKLLFCTLIFNWLILLFSQRREVFKSTRSLTNDFMITSCCWEQFANMFHQFHILLLFCNSKSLNVIKIPNYVGENVITVKRNKGTRQFPFRIVTKKISSRLNKVKTWTFPWLWGGRKVKQQEWRARYFTIQTYDISCTCYNISCGPLYLKCVKISFCVTLYLKYVTIFLLCNSIS